MRSSLHGLCLFALSIGAAGVSIAADDSYQILSSGKMMRREQLSSMGSYIGQSMDAEFAETRTAPTEPPKSNLSPMDRHEEKAEKAKAPKTKKAKKAKKKSQKKKAKKAKKKAKVTKAPKTKKTKKAKKTKKSEKAKKVGKAAPKAQKAPKASKTPKAAEIPKATKKGAKPWPDQKDKKSNKAQGKTKTEKVPEIVKKQERTGNCEEEFVVEGDWCEEVCASPTSKTAAVGGASAGTCTGEGFTVFKSVIDCHMFEKRDDTSLPDAGAYKFDKDCNPHYHIKAHFCEEFCIKTPGLKTYAEHMGLKAGTCNDNDYPKRVGNTLMKLYVRKVDA